MQLYKKRSVDYYIYNKYMTYEIYKYVYIYIRLIYGK